MTRETRLKKDAAERKPIENKGVFAPLGKYAAIAVLLVGVIVTTAIMVDKPLNSVESQIADLESEAVKLNGTSSGSDKTMAKPALLRPENTPLPD